ncbi:uncharacterized protein TNCV_3054551 [Trichonephila clavipes]|nr:uncharacterized protein TNCV_3054551 [Trichonephila clavipes]
MLKVPVTTASVERSFSKLKLIKTYLRSTMSQERLSALSVLSIETEIAASVSYDIILKKCSEAKTEKFVYFNFYLEGLANPNFADVHAWSSAATGYHPYGLASILTGLESNRACVKYAWPTNCSPSTPSHLSTGTSEGIA